uniref:Ecdysoneless homolog (Drosophila) n=1 Tax=Poecilia formosa TaxID=48698 RepID=A0A087YL70_POEFO
MDVLQMRSIPEDMVQYKLFLVQTNGMSSQQTEERLKHLTEEMLAKVAQLLVQYIWQDQPFNLKYHPEKGDVPAHIGGSTRYGDNIEDEWFIVYLLLHLTELFPELAARVEDNDGDFLLIEAADHLPKWLNPDTSENRVFIYRGELHILPCPSKSSSIGFSLDVVPSLAQALVLLSAHPEVCLASPKIRSAATRKFMTYPEKIKANLHRAHCFIPAGVASVLAQRPDLVAPAVSAFYLRDPVDLQACRSFKTFPPDTRVLASVTFTRCLYAQLQQQQFTPDRRSDFDLPPRSHPRYKAHELGTKLAHGFEILCSKSRLPSSEANTPVSCNPQWKNFLESLKKNGYFRGQLEGSAFHKELLRCAEIFFKQSVASKSSSISAGEEILQLLHNSPLNLEEFKKLESQLPPEDSDSWLEVTSQDLEQLLQKRPVEEASGKEEEEDTKEEEAGYSLVAVSQGMKDFLNAMSSHEGAETPWSLQIQPFSFDPGSMANALDKLLGMQRQHTSFIPRLDEQMLTCRGKEEELDNETEEGSSGPAEMSAAETLDSLKSYMDQMDQELQSTNVGKSFSQTNYKACVNNDSSRSPTGDGLLTEEAEEEIQPLDIDVNLVANLLESLSSQAGLAGPASNLLQSLGIQIPPNSDPS